MSLNRLHYKLVGKEVVPCSAMEWLFNQEEFPRVAETTVGNVRISTIFIGINSAMTMPPLVFETAVFDGDDVFIRRYASWQAAEDGHNDEIEYAKAGRTHKDM